VKQPPPFVPLTGADCFLRSFEHEARRWNRGSHVSQLVLRLGPGLDLERFRKTVEEVARAQPIVRAPIGRRRGVGRPVYRLAAGAQRPAPRVESHEAPAAGASAPAPELFSRRLNQRMSMRRGEILRFDAVRYAGGAAGTDLAVSWLHPLFDGTGSELFVRWLDECHRGARGPEELPDPDELTRPITPPGTAGERGAAAMQWKRWLDGFAAHPMRSLAGPRRRVRQALHSAVMTLEEDESDRAMGAASRRAGFLTPMLFYLAAVMRAHHAVFRARGVDPGSYVVPLPVNMRPKSGAGAIFRTHVSLLWFQVLPSQVEDFGALLEELKRQRLAAIKEGLVEKAACALDWARFGLTRAYARLSRMALRGELCSFFFAYTGEFLGGLERFCGAEIRNGYHLAPVLPSPGSCVALSHFRGRLNLSHVFQQGVFSERERELFVESLLADLLA
jgi:hypothetical protein